MRSESIRYLIVPGWHGSPEDHWQSHWQRTLPNSARVEQADWLTPRREDWVAELERCVSASTQPVILVAHSLGCITVAHWAAQQLPGAVAQFRAASPPAVALCQPVDRFRQRQRRQRRAHCRAGPRLGQRNRDTRRRRAYQCDVRASPLGAGFRLPVPLAEPY